MHSPDFFKNPTTPYIEAFSLNTISNQVKMLTSLDEKSNDISKNLVLYGNIYMDISTNFPMYNKEDVEFTEFPKIKDAVNQDINEMIYQQNNTYIIGMFTVTTILILTFVVLQK